MFKKDEYKLFVEIKAVTWQKDSHGLFDYESTNHNVQKFIAGESCSLNIKNDEIKIDFDLGSELKGDSQCLLNLTITRTNALVQQQNQFINRHRQNNPKQQFLIVRSLKNTDGTQKGYNIQLGDIIKFGRIDFKVIEIKGGREKQAKRLQDKIIPKDDDPSKSKECRYCYGTESTDEDVLINLCRCKESIEYVHCSCLKKFISQKSQIKKEGIITNYKVAQFECEICKEPYPISFVKDGRKYNILDIQRSDGPYFILEQRENHNRENSSGSNNCLNLFIANFEDSAANQANNNNNQQVNENNNGEQNQQGNLHQQMNQQNNINNLNNLNNINSLNNIDQQNQSSQLNTVRLGRAHGCDIRISDISVSRLHAMIKYTNNEFLLLDNNSKFGSLVLIQKPYQLKQERIAIQVGRTVITLFLKIVNTSQTLKTFDKKQIERGLLGTKEEFDKNCKFKSKPRDTKIDKNEDK